MENSGPGSPFWCLPVYRKNCIRKMHSSGRENGYDRWTKEETFRLIRARTKLDDEFTSKIIGLRQAWEHVASEADLKKSYDKLRKKWHNLINKYKHIKKPATGVSTEDSCELSKTWIFYDKLEEFFKTRHNINPPFVLNSENVDQNIHVSGSEDHQIFMIEEYDSKMSFEDTLHSTSTETMNILSPTPVSQNTAGNSNAPHEKEINRQDEISRSSTSRKRTCSSSTSGSEKSVRSFTRRKRISSLTSGAASASERKRRKMSEMEKDEMKTNKKIRKVAKIFEKFMRNKFDIVVDSSDSE